MRWFFGLLIAAAFTIPSQLRYNANITGSVSRPIASKLADVVSAKDFLNAGNCDGTAIQSAITAAGTTGWVLIPGDCTGTYTNANNVPVLDFRVIAASTGMQFPGPLTQGFNGTECGPGGVGDNCFLSVYHTIQPMRPAPQSPTEFPQGNDLLLGLHGTGDLVMRIAPYDLTSTTSVAPGTTTVTVVSGVGGLPGVTDTTGLCPNTASHGVGGCNLLIDPDTANEEVLDTAHWSITNATQLSITVVNSHTQPYTIRQEGSSVFDHHRIVVRPFDATGKTFLVQDRNLFTILKLPNDTSGAWPAAGVEFDSYITGGFRGDATNSLRFRLNGVTSRYVFLNSAASSELLAITNAGAATILNGLTISGGGLAVTGTFSSNSGATMFGLTNVSAIGSNAANPASAGFFRLATGDNLLFRNNANSGDINGLSKSTGDIVAVGGPAGILPGGTTQASLGTPANGTMTYCSDCTIANPCAGGGTGAIAKRLNGVWVCN